MNQIPPPAARPKLTTGIAGLDDILVGGLEAERVYLVEGTPGTGKTTLALQFLLAGVQQGERALYVTLSESELELRAAAFSHGWSLDGLSIYELIAGVGLDAEAEQTVLHPSELELGEITREVISRVQDLNPVRVVFDSLSELRLLAQNPLRYRRQVLALKQFFTQRRCTVLLLDDRTARNPGGTGDLQLHSISHGVLTLEQLPVEFGTERRRLRVVKLRGSRYRGGYHDFTIEEGGLAVYPRLIGSEHHADYAPAPVGSGNAGLDRLLGGGIIPGTNTLLVGPSGVGKTTLATTAVFAALQRGASGAFFLFDEGLNTFLNRSAALGMELRPFIGEGRLSVRQINPAEMSPGRFSHLVRLAVERDHASIVVIDSLNAFMQSMPGEKYLLLQMHEMLTYLNQLGAITLMSLGQHGAIGQTTSDVDLSYLADSVVMIRFFEADGEVRKALSVLKTRTSEHERTIRELSIGRGGIEVGPPLRGFPGVRGGAPAWDETPPGLRRADGPLPATPA